MSFKGIVTDVRPAEQPEGTYRWAQNKMKTRKHRSIADDLPVSLDPVDRAPEITSQEDEVFIGEISLNQEESLVFSAVYFNTDVRVVRSSRIFILHSNGTHTPIIDDPILNFSESSIIDGFVITNFDGTRSVIFTDGHNPVRMLNVDSPEVKLTSNKAFVDPKQIALLDYFLQVDIPDIAKIDVEDSGGSLLTGVYYYAINYQVGENGYTNYMPISNPVPITDSKRYGGFAEYDGVDGGVISGKSVTLHYSGLDTNFERFNLGIIKRINGQVSCEMIPGGVIDKEGKGKITHTGAEIATPILLEDIVINNADYKTAKTITFHDNKVYMGNLSTEDYQGQEEANEIEVEWVFDEDVSIDGVRGSFKDGEVCFNSKSFMPGEVYAFYISWLKNSGGYTPAYLISGRKSKNITFAGETFDETARIEDVQTQIGSAGYLDEDLLLDKDVKFFHTRDTSSVDTTIYDTAESTTQAVGGIGTMGYWENEELYPDEFPGFAGENVRHHRFPSLNKLSSAGLLHTVLDGQEPKLETEKFEITAHTETVDLLEPEENKLVYDVPVDTGTLTTVGYASGAVHGNGGVLEITFNKKCEVSWDILADITGCKVVRSAVIGWWPKKQRAKLHMSMYAEGHGDLFPAIDSEESTNWLSYYNVLDVREKVERGGFMTMRKGDKILLDISADRGIHHVHDFKLSFSVKQWSISDADIEGSMFTNSLGIKLSNIRTPKHLEGKVKGFQIFYAKRTLQNTTVFAMGQPLDYLTVSKNPASGASDFRIHPADLMVNNSFPSIGLSYIRHEVNLLTDLAETGQGYTSTTDDNIVSRVQEYGYEPHNDGTFSEALFRYQLVNATSEWTSGKLVTLMGYKKNLYSVYYDQQLVCTGPVFYTGRESIEKLYGGDTFINTYAFRATNETEDNVFQHLVWSAAHIGYRQSGEGYGEMYYPQNNIPGEFGDLPEGVTSNKNDNFVKVNSDYSSLNDFNQVYPDNVTRTRIHLFPNRVIASTAFHIESDTSMLRRVLPGDYYELTKDKGVINNLESYAGELLIHTTHSLFKTISSAEFDSSEIAVTVGSGNLFRLPPKELFYDKLGVAGTLHQSSSKVLNGHYIFIDERVGQIYALRQSLSSFSANGNKIFFENNMKFKVVEQLRELNMLDFNADYPHSALGIGYSVGYDEEFKRYFVTKKDFKLKDTSLVVNENPLEFHEDTLSSDVTWTGDHYEFTVTYESIPGLMDMVVIASGDPLSEYEIEEIESLGSNQYKLKCVESFYNKLIPDGATGHSITVRGQVYKDVDKVYFYEGLLYDNAGRLVDRDSLDVEDCSWTVSFTAEGDLISEHSHTPGMYISSKNSLRSTSGSQIYRHNSLKDPIEADSYIDIVSTFGRLSRVASVIIDSSAYSQDGKLLPKQEFDSMRVFNDSQCSTEVEITGNKGRSGALVVNNFLDHVGEDIDFIENNEIDDDKLNAEKPKRFFSTFIITRLINRNIANKFVLLYNAKAKEIPL